MAYLCQQQLSPTIQIQRALRFPPLLPSNLRPPSVSSAAKRLEKQLENPFPESPSSQQDSASES